MKEFPNLTPRKHLTDLFSKTKMVTRKWHLTKARTKNTAFRDLVSRRKTRAKPEPGEIYKTRKTSLPAGFIDHEDHKARLSRAREIRAGERARSLPPSRQQPVFPRLLVKLINNASVGSGAS